MPPPNPRFIDNIVRFCRLLRQQGMTVGPDRVELLVDALSRIELGDKEDVFWACAAVLTQTADELSLLRWTFESFWADRQLQPAAMGKTGSKASGSDSADRENRAEHGIAAGQAEDGTPLELGVGYSQDEILRQRDFADMNEDELAEVLRLLRTKDIRLETRWSRRLHRGGKGRLDVRRSLQRSVRRGGEWLEWLRLDRRRQPKPLLLLADISGSMQRYSRVLIQFMLWLGNRPDLRSEMFLFGTRLTYLSPHWRAEIQRGNLDLLAAEVPDWSGGTRIGPSLKEFNQSWARRVLAHGSVAILLSDGWDRGDPELLREQLARLSRGVNRLIWLNPLLGDERYRPLTRGMQTALPYIDDFLPAHNLASLEVLLDHLRLDQHHRAPMPAPQYRGARST